MNKSNGTQRKFTWTQGLWTAAGLLLLGGSLLALLKGKDGLLPIAVPLGASMLSAGAINIVIYHFRQKCLHGTHWLLADGMATALLSLFLLFNRVIYAAMIPFFFGVWELFSGICKFIDSRELRENHIRGWHQFSGIGIIEIVSGIAALLKPVDEFVGMHGVVAIVLLIQSCGYLLKVLIYPHLVIENKEKEPSKL